MNNISPTTEEAHAAVENTANELESMSADEQETQRALWQAELSQVEDEIATLRTVLASKVRRSTELKKKLGITVWKELSEDVNQGFKNVKESNVWVYQEIFISDRRQNYSEIKEAVHQRTQTYQQCHFLKESIALTTRTNYFS